MHKLACVYIFVPYHILLCRLANAQTQSAKVHLPSSVRSSLPSAANSPSKINFGHMLPQQAFAIHFIRFHAKQNWCPLPLPPPLHGDYEISLALGESAAWKCCTKSGHFSWWHLQIQESKSKAKESTSRTLLPCRMLEDIHASLPSFPWYWNDIAV